MAGPDRDPDRHRRLSTPAAPVVVDEQIEPAAEAKPERHGKRWNPEEDQQLLDAFLNDKMDVRELAAHLERSPSSIASRLLHLDAVEVRPKR